MDRNDQMNDSFKMQGHKLIWHLKRVEAWLDQKGIAPLYLDMGITQSCNMACKYCYYGTPKNRTNKIIATDVLIQFLRDASKIGVKAIGFLGDGEPMIHPGVYDAVIAGKEAGLDMAISSNGLLLNENRAHDFLKALTWIRFNLSAAEPITFESVMGISANNFYKVKENIKKCVEIKNTANLDVTIGMQMVLISDCKSQLVQYAKLGRELGVDYIVVKQCSESDGVKQDFLIDDYDALEPIMREAESYATSDYQVIIKRRKMHKERKEYDQCFGCEFLPQISGAGDVYPCGNLFGNEKYYIGNLHTERFLDIVQVKKYKQVMEKVKSQINVHKECGFKCRQNEINEFLWKLRNPPEHINFI